VRLPLAHGDVRTAEKVSGAGARARRRVLVVEDNVDAADSLREALELGGHTVDVARDGPAGLAAARALRPEVVLCDIGLPGMDGYEVARAIRADPELGGTFLVALSGYTMPVDVQRATDAGFERHLSKPASLDELEALLGTLGAAAARGAA
jgi:two-component system CheB/CheR fusion protein